ncbi:MAG: tyrosine-protein phosphatase, partial [Desulfobacteraceae bacterium]
EHAVFAFQRVLHGAGIPLTLYPGADVHLSQDMMGRIQDQKACTLNNQGKYILIELPSHSVPGRVEDELFELKINGITPIITHPERNPMIQKDPDLLYQWIQKGALAQVTAMSVIGDFGEMVGQSARTLLARRLVQVIASDAHSARDRPPCLLDAVQEAAQILHNEKEARQMVLDRPAAMLAGRPCPVPEPVDVSHRKRGAAWGSMLRVWDRMITRTGQPPQIPPKYPY